MKTAVDVLQALALPLDDPHLGQRAAQQRVFRVGRKVLGQEVHVEPDRRQGVLDLVGQPPGQLGDLRVLIDELLMSVVHNECSVC